MLHQDVSQYNNGNNVSDISLFVAVSNGHDVHELRLCIKSLF